MKNMNKLGRNTSITNGFKKSGRHILVQSSDHLDCPCEATHFVCNTFKIFLLNKHFINQKPEFYQKLGWKNMKKLGRKHEHHQWI